MNDPDEWGLAFMDEIPVPKRGVYTRRSKAAPVVIEPPKRGPGRKLTREQAEASLAAYIAKHGERGTRKGYAALGDDVTFSRFVKTGVVDRKPKHRNRPLPGFANPSIEAGRSIFHARGVKPVAALKNVLVSGHANVKIGRDVRKGKLFRGYWIYTLSLEERATCPRSCHHWNTCYGNNMPYAKRVEHGHALHRALEREVLALLAPPRNGRAARAGILVRLHALGDFYSPEYVAFWDAMLKMHPRLAVFGYTAWSPDSEIGAAVARVKALHGPRFAIRWSNGSTRGESTVPIIAAADCPPTAFVCPEQTGRVDGCGKCGLCWSSPRDVAFLEH